MDNNKVSSGSKIIDSLLEGGYECDIVTTVYGPAGSGKTNLCLIASRDVAKTGKKVLFVDSEGGFSVERLRQICNDNDIEFRDVMENMLFLRPTSFEEQESDIKKLKEIVREGIGLIVIDTISMHYRLELGKNDEVSKTNQVLSEQVDALLQIARKSNIPTIVTNQVYSDFENKEQVRMVGGNILSTKSKCLIELKSGHNGIRRAILRKHRSLPEGKEVMFKIVQDGIKEIKKGF